jgi:hypothetical protein
MKKKTKNKTRINPMNRKKETTRNTMNAHMRKKETTGSNMNTTTQIHPGTGIKLIKNKSGHLLIATIAAFLLLFVPIMTEAEEIPVTTVTGTPASLTASPVQYLVDGDPETYWALQPGTTSGWAVLTLEVPALIHGLEITCDLRPGRGIGIGNSF